MMQRMPTVARAVTARTRATAPPTRFMQRQQYHTVAVYNREEVAQRVKALQYEVQGSNWSDYLVSVQNGPLWEAEYDRVQHMAAPYATDAVIGADLKKLHETLDAFYATEDVRDHINELLELTTRATGVMGTGFMAGPKIENLDENAKKLVEAYDSLMAKYPAFKPKIELTVGHGLALLRMKHKFIFPSQHRFFF